MKRSKLVYFFILAEIVFLNIMYRRYWPFWLLIFMILITALLYANLICIKHTMRISEECDDLVITKGDTAVIRLSINNRFAIGGVNMHVHLLIRNSINDEWTPEIVQCSVASKQNKTISVEIYGEHIGYTDVILKKIVLYDYLYLFKTGYRQKKEYRITVIPKPIVSFSREAYLSKVAEEEGERYSEEKPGNDVSQVFDIREYMDGDRISRIHWKLSNKVEKLIVKEYSLLLENEINIVFDKTIYDSFVTDTMYDALNALLRRSMESGKIVRVYYKNNGDNYLTCGSSLEIVELFTKLIAAPVNNEYIELNKWFIGQKDNLFYIVPQISDEELMSLTETYGDSIMILTANQETVDGQVLNIKDWVVYE